jgi:hypothetical protein
VAETCSRLHYLFCSKITYLYVHLLVVYLTKKTSVKVSYTIGSSSSSSIGTTTLSWVSACSTAVEHSQQEGFRESLCQRHVKPPTWRRSRELERSNFRHKRPPTSEATLANPAAEGGTMGEKWPRILPKVATSTSLLGSFNAVKHDMGQTALLPLRMKAS